MSGGGGVGGLNPRGYINGIKKLFPERQDKAYLRKR